MTRVSSMTLGTVVLAGLFGCADISNEVLQELARPTNEFLLGPEDVLDVVVWRNQDLSREVIVRPDGKISMPLIGDVQASGRTAEQLAERIVERLREFKETPTVSVSVKEVNSYTLYMVGEVARPGKFQLKSYVTVLQAIAMAGGFTQFASRNKMQVIRNSANGDRVPHEIHIPVRYDDLLNGVGVPDNFILKSGDIVVVP